MTYKFILSIAYAFIIIFSSAHALDCASHTFGYLDYSSRNIGDDIQSIAAKKFLPKTAIPVNRDFVNQFQSDSVTNTIMNGWFMDTKKSGWRSSQFSAPHKSWPPAPSINPLLISMHFTQSFFPEVFTDEGIKYLKKYGPVGARDYATLKELMNRNIPSYFSGCLTLTLENTASKRENIIYAVDLNDRCVQFIRSRANCKVECISHIISEEIAANKQLRETYAQDLLEKYKRARCVITSRLHAAMPCLGFETPVLLINTQYDQYRFEGLKELTHNCSEMEFLSGRIAFDINKPPENPQDYLPIRENLIQIVSEWVQTYEPTFKCEAHISTPSLHILIATAGRSSLLSMLKSLQPQLRKNDYLTVVFDAKDHDNVFHKVEEYLKEFRCVCSLIMEPINLGYWGHGIRNHHNHLPGDFIMHADDDDTYAGNALDMVRKHCTDKSTLYIFKMQHGNQTLWINHKIIAGQIGTPMGVIPSAYNSKSTWTYRYGGDFDFYDGLRKVVPQVKFIDQVIYLVRPQQLAFSSSKGCFSNCVYAASL